MQLAATTTHETPNATHPASTTAELPVVTPAVDLVESPESFILHADVAGADESSVEVTLERGVLTLRAVRRLPRPAGAAPAYVEFGDVRFERSFTLASDQLNVDAIEARLASGVLTVTVPKAAPAQARRISVRSS